MSMYPPPAPAVKKGMSPTAILLMVLGIIVALCLLLLGGCYFMMNSMFSQMSPIVGCMFSSEMMEKSAQAYALDHKGQYPNPAKWEDELDPYYTRLYNKNEKEFKKMREMPMVGGMFVIKKPGETFQCGKGKDATGFAFNSDLAGVDKAKIANPATTPMFFEVKEVKRNNALPAAQMPKGNAPRLMNEEREWIIYYIEGNRSAFDSNSSSKKGDFNLDLDPEDARDPAKK